MWFGIQIKKAVDKGDSSFFENSDVKIFASQKNNRRGAVIFLASDCYK